MREKPRVVEFKPRKKPREADFPATVKPRDFSKECHHQQVTVDDKGRTVECSKCGASLDPLSTLAWIAHHWDGEKWRIGQSKKLDQAIHQWHEAGGRIRLYPKSVTVEFQGRRWASRCSGGALAQLESALETARFALKAETSR